MNFTFIPESGTQTVGVVKSCQLDSNQSSGSKRILFEEKLSLALENEESKVDRIISFSNKNTEV